MLYRIPFLAIVILALVALVAPSPLTADDKMHEATVLQAGDGKITLTFHGDAKKHVHEVAKDAVITLDGKPAKLEELKEGFPVKVMLNDKSVISMIDAKSKKK